MKTELQLREQIKEWKFQSSVLLEILPKNEKSKQYLTMYNRYKVLQARIESLEWVLNNDQ